RVVPVLLDEPEHVGVDHPGAQDLDPADSLAERIAGAVREPSAAAAAEAGDVDLDARLREGKEPGPEARLALRAEDRPGELVESALQVGEGDVLADSEPLNLVEHRAMGGVERVRAVAAPRYDDEDRR